MNTTSITLLARLKSANDDEAWSRFVQLYTPLLYHWCRRVGLNTEDAGELVQDVLTHLVTKLRDFDYDANRSFRQWLRIVTINKWHERQRRRTLPYSADAGCLEQVAADDRSWQLEEAEYRMHLVRSALPLIRPEFSETTWKVFEEHVLGGRSAREVAERTGVRLGTVYAAKSRVLTRLRQELAEFLDD